MAHGFSATITMTTDRYAEVFAAAGLAVAALRPSQLRRAVRATLASRSTPGCRPAATATPSSSSPPGPESMPARIALWGDSFSGAVVLVVAGVDDRVAAVVAQVPATGREPAPSDPDGRLFDALRETLLAGDITGGPETTVGPMPVVSADQIHSPSLLTPIQAYRWFIEYGGRFGTGWENRATRVTPATPAPFHASWSTWHGTSFPPPAVRR